MASLHYEEHSEMYSPFPSSPEQVAVFSPSSSPTSEDDYFHYPGGSHYFGTYEQSELEGKLTQAAVNRQKRRVAPMGSRQLKRDFAPSHVVCYPTHFSNISEACYLDSSMNSGLSAEGFAPAYDMSSSAGSALPSPATPLSCDELVPTYMPTSGRIKSTTPNLGLLFSLFDVLEAQEEASSPYSSQQASSPCYSPSRASTHQAAAPETRSPPAQVPELLPAPASRSQAHFYSRQYQLPYPWTQEEEVAEFPSY